MSLPVCARGGVVGSAPGVSGSEEWDNSKVATATQESGAWQRYGILLLKQRRVQRTAGNGLNALLALLRMTTVMAAGAFAGYSAVVVAVCGGLGFGKL